MKQRVLLKVLLFIMVKCKRQHTQNAQDNRSSSTALSSQVMSRAIHTTVCLASCVPLTREQKIVTGGVTRLKQMSNTSGFRAGLGNAVFITIAGNLQGEL